MKRTIYLLAIVVFILSVVGLTEAEAIQMTPQDIVDLIDSTTFASEAVIAEIALALHEMSLAELSELFTTIELEKPLTDYYLSPNVEEMDLRLVVLLRTELEASYRFVTTYRYQNISSEDMAPIREFFAPHPLLLSNLMYLAEMTAEALTRKAEPLEAKARMRLELQAANLYELSENSEFLLIEFLGMADNKNDVD